MSIKKRIDSILVELAMSPSTPAASLEDHTTGGERDNTPRGAFQKLDNDRIEEILLGAVVAVERLSGRVWDGTRHVARKHQPYDEKHWQLHVLKTYQGVRHGLAAQEENVERHVIRDLRKRCGLDNLGYRKEGLDVDPKFQKIVDEAEVMTPPIRTTN